MKMYYIENLINKTEIEQSYLIDFEFGFLLECIHDDHTMVTYDNWDDFYRMWDNSNNFELDSKKGKQVFNKNAVMVRVL